jgi:hypothetical protein
MDNCGYLDAEFRLVDENKLITKASPKYPTSPSVEVVNKLAEKSSDIIVNLDRSPEQLNLEVINIESTPSRMICQCKHNFGPVYHDDHIDVILDLGQDFEYLLQINPKGYYNFSRLDKRTGLSHYTDCIDSIFVESVIATDKWTAKISLPFKSSDSFLLEVKRHRALYANQIKASEQRIAETISWSGLKNGRIRITKGYT